MRKVVAVILLFILVSHANGQIIEEVKEKSLFKDEVREVTGKVLHQTDDSSFVPLPGVHVMVKGTHRGTTTDTMGLYMIKATGHDIFIYSFVSMQTEERPVDFHSRVDVVMEEDYYNLSNVVVIGHLPLRKEEMQSSVSIIKMQEYDQQPMSNALSGMQGRMPGVNVLNASGVSNNIFTRIRGNSSYLASNDPLYLFEGLPISLDNLNWISYNGHSFRPQLDFGSIAIGSIEVIRDAATGSIYGSRGAKGVVQIKAPRGRTGQPHIHYSIKTGIVEPMTRQYEPLDTTEYFNYLDDLAPTIGSPNIQDHRDLLLAAGISRSQYRANTNWREHIFKNGFFLENQLSISGGTEKQQYYLGVAKQNMEGVVQRYGRQRNDFIFSYQHQITDRLEGSLVVLGSSTDYSLGFIGENLWSQMRAYLLPPHLKPYDEQGEIIDNFAFIGLENPVAQINDHYYKQDLSNERLLGILDLSYRLSHHFAVKYKGGMDINLLKENTFTSSKLFFGTAEGQSLASSTHHQTHLHEGSVHYKNMFDDHRIEASAGVSNTFSKIDARGIVAFGVASATLNTINNTGGHNSGGDWIQEKVAQSFFTNAFYQFQNRFFLMGNFRYDGSSVLAPGHQYTGFWGANAGWILSNESFFEVSWVDRLKLFTGYGKTGNSLIDARKATHTRAYYGSSGGGGFGYASNPDMAPINIGNTNFTWEVTREWNTGLEFFLFKKRLAGNVSVYHRKTLDLIQEQPMHPSSGFSFYLSNFGDVTNTGLELGLESQNFKAGSAWQWASSFNISFNHNALVWEEPVFTEQYAYLSGHPMPSFYVYEMDRVDAETGDIIWVDQNGDGQISEADRVVKGRTTPSWFGGLNNRITWKRLEFNLLLQFAGGHQVYNQSRAMLEGMANVYNQSAAVKDRWQQTGDETDVPRAAWGDPAGNNRISDRFLEDATYLRIKFISLTYTFPEILKGRYIKHLRVFISVNNLATLTGYRGHDPEIYFPENKQVETNLDFLNYPKNRIYTAGLNISF